MLWATKVALDVYRQGYDGEDGLNARIRIMLQSRNVNRLKICVIVKNHWREYNSCLQNSHCNRRLLSIDLTFYEKVKVGMLTYLQLGQHDCTPHKKTG